MTELPRPGGRKLVKRRSGSAGPSPSRDRAQSGNRHSQPDTPAVPPIDLETTPMPQEGTSPGKEKRSKWRLSNPFHAKDKDRKDSVAVAAGDPVPVQISDTAERPPAARNSATAGDSAYFSSEHVNSSNDTSGHPSFSSAERRGSHGEQLQAPTATLQPPTTSVTPPTPSASLSQGQATQLPLQPSPSVQAQTDDVHRESYTDQRTGNVVTTTTTVSSTQVQKSDMRL